MCYNIAFLTKRQEIYEKRYGARFQTNVSQPTYHASGFSHPEVPVITADDRSLFHFMHWGLVPFWIKSAFEAEKIKKQTLNARLETLSEKPAFREAYKKRRCLVPVDAFFEYHHQGKKAIPFLIKSINEEPLSLAGIYEVWVSPLNGIRYHGFSIVTCAAHGLMQKVHNHPGEAGPRQPLMLNRLEEESWLSNEDFKPIGIPDDQLEVYAVTALNGKKYPGNSPLVWEKGAEEILF